ncbi:ABC transporter ATP-binding protein [Paenibacillus harenae]|uniref:ABC transport system ATP-binding protein n=1 Tax=Paenibacillus harenae TaxID=306543 RepID=A0ABT9UAT7_PAEHA|nr:ABC transporter ATP-binding protein [Paenibacillus harenae]MDQ0115574.1 putative ABC transport system ATP-binding protein [Paenibacillus harenae]
MSTVILQEVSKSYELGRTSVPALRGIDLEIQEGEFVTMAGTSGSGKSTLLNLIGCLDVPTTGEVWIGDTLVSDLDDKQLNETRLRQIGFIFQSFNLIPVLNVYENVELPLLIMKEVSKKERKKRIDYFLNAVGLSSFADRKPSELSGGQRQRVAVARALVTKPRIVLADEPTANLDSKTGIEIIELMQQINKREKTTFIFSTHDPKVMQRANRIFHLVDGKIEKVENIR